MARPVKAVVVGMVTAWRTFTVLSICLRGDPCDLADTTGFEYLAVGVTWDCPDFASRQDPPYAGCSPDYTTAHDPAQPRVRLEINHQQATAWEDTEPFYRAPAVQGTYGDVSVLI